MVYWNLVCSVNCYYFSKIINDQWINELKYIFNFSFQIRCPRMDQDFSSLDSVRDYLQTYSKCSTFYFVQSITLLTQKVIYWSSLKDVPPWSAWNASMNLCASPLLPLKNHWPFPHLHHPSAITTTCHCCRVLACWAGACKYLDERKNGCTRGRHVRKEAASVPERPVKMVSYLLSNYLKVTVWSLRNFDREWLTLAQTKGCTLISLV